MIIFMMLLRFVIGFILCEFGEVLKSEYVGLVLVLNCGLM